MGTEIPKALKCPTCFRPLMSTASPLCSWCGAKVTPELIFDSGGAEAAKIASGGSREVNEMDSKRGHVVAESNGSLMCTQNNEDGIRDSDKSAGDFDLRRLALVLLFSIAFGLGAYVIIKPRKPEKLPEITLGYEQLKTAWIGGEEYVVLGKGEAYPLKRLPLNIPPVVIKNGSVSRLVDKIDHGNISLNAESRASYGRDSLRAKKISAAISVLLFFVFLRRAQKKKNDA